MANTQQPTSSSPADPAGDFPVWLKWAMPAFILACAVVMRLAGLDKSLWVDEANSFGQAHAKDFIATARIYEHPPLYYALLRVGLHLTQSLTLLRLLSVACGLGTVTVFCFFFGRHYRLAGWCAALLLAASPGFVRNSQELVPYALLSLELSLALAFAWRVVRAPQTTAALVGLACALAAAACTHLITIFFIAALVATMGWNLRHERPAILIRIACAFVPAMLFVWFFKSVFLLRTVKSPELWWIPPVSPGLLRQVFSEDMGWNALAWLAEACDRHLAGAGGIFLVVSALGAAFVVWTAWGRPLAGAAHHLLETALIYWILLIGYSLAVLPLVWPRMMLPGMLPFLLGLGLGVATHPCARQRAMAVATIILLALAMMVPWLRGLAFQPTEDLRGFTSALQRNTHPSDLLIMINGVEISFEPYWPGYKQYTILKLELQDPLPSLLASVQTAHARQPAGSAVLLVYRADAYVALKSAALKAIATQLSAGHASPEKLWDKNAYCILRFHAAPRD